MQLLARSGCTGMNGSNLVTNNKADMDTVSSAVS
jgi:hypothetical protein